MPLNFQTFTSTDLLDKTGAAASWLCAIHCLALPFLISFLPLTGVSFLAREEIEYVFIAVSCALAVLSLLPAYFRQHRKIRTLFLFVAGICCVALADAIFEESIIGKMLFVLAGAVFITSAHFINRRLCRNCRKCTDENNMTA